MVKKITITIVFNILVLAATGLVFAETEEQPLDSAWVTRFDNSEWVALVRVESVNSLVNQALSAEAGVMAIQGYNYAFTVQQQWKDTSESQTKLRVDLSDCPLLLTLDSDYVVFADRNYRGGLQLSSCDHFVHASEAGALISWLSDNAVANNSSQQAAAVNQ